MDRGSLERWMRGYVAAWESNDPAAIGDLFTEDATYYTTPARPPWRGREEIVRGWIGIKDEPGHWTFRWEVLDLGEVHGFVRGWTTYTDEAKGYRNLWVIRLEDDGRCSEFTEWWMKEPAAAG